MKRNIVVSICLLFISKTTLGMGGNARTLVETAKKLANSEQSIVDKINSAKSTNKLIEAYTEANKAEPAMYPSPEIVEKIIKIVESHFSPGLKQTTVAKQRNDINENKVTRERAFVQSYIELKEILGKSFLNSEEVFQIIEKASQEIDKVRDESNHISAQKIADFVKERVAETALSDISSKTNPLDLNKNQVTQAIDKLKTSRWFDFKERAEARKTIRNHLNEANKTLADIQNKHGNKFIDQQHKVNTEINTLQAHINETHQNFHNNLTFVDKVFELFR